jgi:hypothetical protein
MACTAIFAARPLGRAKADFFGIRPLSARRLMAAAQLREIEWRTILPFTNHQPVID